MAMNIINRIRADFPALEQKMNGEQLIYLDSAATSQKPKSVLSLMEEMAGRTNANVHRAMYALSDKATELYETAREVVREFINAPARENIIFTSGTTASINLVADSFCRTFLKANDAIIIAADSHHSNIVPWQLAAQRTGAEIRVLPISTEPTPGRGFAANLLVEELENLIDEKVKIVAVTHVSNITGLVNQVERVIEIAHRHNIPVVVDGAQGIVHQAVDVQKMGCDFYAFSAHKIYGATGAGVLYGKRELLEQMPPYMGGGDMVETVTYQKTTYAPLPLKFEAGTPNFIGAASLAPALEYAKWLKDGILQSVDGESVSVCDVVEAEQKKITEYLTEALFNEVGDVQLYGFEKSTDASTGVKKELPLFTFNIKGANAGDLAQLLDKMGVAVRSGLMCAEPLLNSLGATGALRASFAPYNTLEEAKKFIACLRRAKQMVL